MYAIRYPLIPGYQDADRFLGQTDMSFDRTATLVDACRFPTATEARVAITPDLIHSGYVSRGPAEVVEVAMIPVVVRVVSPATARFQAIQRDGDDWHVVTRLSAHTHTLRTGLTRERAERLALDLERTIDDEPAAAGS